MSFAQHLIPRIFHKQDQVRKQLKRINLYTDELNHPNVITLGLQLFHNFQKQQQQQQAIKSLIKLMQQKTTYMRKLKLLLLIVQITKQTKYDIADILISKKLKLFTKSSSSSMKLPSQLNKHSLEQYILIELLIPLYNYMMKLSVNQELFNTCCKKQIPHDQIFRRGMKIRFIWIFKLYNLIHTLIPILQVLVGKFMNVLKYSFFNQLASYLYNDILVMNNFILKAIDQAAEDNYILMPYFDMLQFYQSLTQQLETSKKVLSLWERLRQCVEGLQKPMQLTLKKEDIQEIQVQALRVKLISNTLKNPKKDHTRLQTQYNVKSQYRQKINKQKASLTQGNQQQQESEDIQAVKQRFRKLDINKNKLHYSMQQVSDQQQEDGEQQIEQQLPKQENQIKTNSHGR